MGRIYSLQVKVKLTITLICSPTPTPHPPHTLTNLSTSQLLLLLQIAWLFHDGFSNKTARFYTEQCTSLLLFHNFEVSQGTSNQSLNNYGFSFFFFFFCFFFFFFFYYYYYHYYFATTHCAVCKIYPSCKRKQNPAKWVKPCSLYKYQGW